MIDAEIQALTEMLTHATDLGDDEICNDIRAALRGDREALAWVILDTQTRSDYSAWAPL